MSEPFSEDPPVDPTIDPDLAPPESVKVRQPKEDRRIVGEWIETEEEPEEEEIVLTNEERANFSRAITIGRRTKTVDIADCQVSIQTLKSGDEMRIGLYTKPYLDSQGFARAYQIGVCAAGITDIKDPSGNPYDLWESLTEIKDKQKIFNKNCEALEEFRPVMTTKIYQAIMDLEREDADLGLKLGKY